MDKKTKKILITIVLFIIALISIEAIIRLIISTTKKVVENHNQKVAQEKYKETEEYVEEVYLEECIEKTITLMKSNDYETLYSLLDPIYKEYKDFTNIDKFKEYMVNYIGIPTSIELVQYNKNYGKYVCTFKIINDVGSTTRKILIEEKENIENLYNFNIIFDEIYYIKEYDANVQKASNNINYQIAYRLKYSDYSAYVMKVTNQNKKAVNLSLADTYISKTNKKDYFSNDLDTLSDLNIGAGETKTVVLKISDASSYMYEDSYISINPKIDGKKGSTVIITMSSEYFE